MGEIGHYNFAAEREKRQKEEEARQRVQKLEQARVIATLKKLIDADEPVTWKTDRYGHFEVSSSCGVVQVKLDDEHAHGSYSISRTGRFAIVVSPQLGSYSNTSAASTRFRARKEGWTDVRVREIAAKIVLGLARASEANKHISAAKKVEASAKLQLKKEKLYHDYNNHDRAPCTVSVRNDDGSYSVSYHVRLPTLTLDQAIAVAKFVNELVKP